MGIEHLYSSEAYIAYRKKMCNEEAFIEKLSRGNDIKTKWLNKRLERTKDALEERRKRRENNQPIRARVTDSYGT